VFGGAGFHVQLQQGISFAAEAANDVSGALFKPFEYYPLSNVLSILAILLLTVFFVTSADSATYVLAMMGSNGNLHPPLSKKVAWGIVQSSAAAVLLLSGGLEALQRMAIIAALPFTVVMVLMVRSLLKAMRYEVRHEWTERRTRRNGDLG
jgi:glycine betaine transporter